LLIPEVSAKGLSLLREAVPALTKVAVLWNAANSVNSHCIERCRGYCARAIGVTLRPQQVREPKDFEPAFTVMTQDRPDGLLVLADALLYQYKSRIVDFTIRTQLPAVFPFQEFTKLGGLMSYGPNLPDMFRMAANYVHKILKGEKPADLPIEQPTKFQFVINLKAAKALGIAVPLSVRRRGDRVRRRKFVTLLGGTALRGRSRCARSSPVIGMPRAQTIMHKSALGHAQARQLHC
jgi:putative ABC transport system substrate-binding protein